MRVLVFGASITQGFWDTEGGWVQRLRRYYDQKSVANIKEEENYPDIFNLGVSGNKSGDLLARFDNETAARLKTGSSGVIIFCIGTNNAYVEGNESWSPPEVYKNDLLKLVDKAKKYVNKILFVGLPPCEEEKTTPVFWRDISYTNERIQVINGMMQEVAAEQNIPRVEIFEAMHEAMKSGQQLFLDGLHPNDAGHQLIFELVRPELDKLLNT